MRLMLNLRTATEADVSLILQFIRDLAEYERLLDACVATEESVRETLFGERRYAEVIIAEHDGQPAGFALFFHNYFDLPLPCRGSISKTSTCVRSCADTASARRSSRGWRRWPWSGSAGGWSGRY